MMSRSGASGSVMTVSSQLPRTAMVLSGCVFLLMACGGHPSSQSISSASSSSSASRIPGASASTIDCGQPGSPIAAMVCGDPQLSALNRQVGTEYQSSLSSAGDQSAAQAAQSNWANGRDQCSKAADVRACVLQTYQTRLAELKIARPDTPTPPTNSYKCDNTSRQLTTIFYNDFQPPAMVLRWGSDTAILFQQMMGSGIRYTRDGVEYGEHQGSVQVDFYGTKLSCTTS